MNTTSEKEHLVSDKKTSMQPIRVKGVDKKNTSFILQLSLVILLVGAGFISWNSARGIVSTIDEKEAETEEAARPANLEITTITDKNCTTCTPLDSYINYIKEQNVKIIKETNLDLADSEAQVLIKKYGVNKLPFFSVSGEITKQDDLQALWTTWGSVSGDTFTLSSIYPPYLDLNTNEVMGSVSITYLSDASCTECYDVTVNKSILERNYGVLLADETTIDISDPEGKELVQKYSITKVPTFILNNEVAVYQALLNVWDSVGSVESDGIYILRSVEQLGAYYDLESQELVNPAAVQEETTESTQ